MASTYTFQHTLIVDDIDCSRQCSGHFQVAKADENNKQDHEKRGEESNKMSGEEGDKESNNEGGERFYEEPNAERDDENDEDGDEEVISPASYVNQGYLLKRLIDNR
jgi:hypothetical protein